MAGKVVVIWTSKGGVGKTLVSTNLALHLTNPLSDVRGAWKFGAEEGLEETKKAIKDPEFQPTRVCFVDSDGLRSGFTLLGNWGVGEDGSDTPPDSEATLADYYEEKVSVDELLNPSAEGGELCSLINADIRLGDSSFIVSKVLPRADLSKRLFKELRERFDYIVVDTPYQATADGFPKFALKEADGILLLATPNSSDVQGYINSVNTIVEVLGKEKGWDRILGTVLNRTQTKLDEAGKNLLDDSEDEVLSQVRELMGRDRIVSIIPESGFQRSAQKNTQPLFSYARYSPPSRELLRVAVEIKKRFK